MKKKSQKNNAKSMFTLLLVFLFGLSPFFIKAQQQDLYKSSKGVLVGTSDTRLFASVNETDTTVTMTVRAAGYMKADNIAFSIFYDPNVMLLLNKGNVVTTFDMFQQDAAIVDPFFPNNEWVHYGTHKNKGTGYTDLVSGHTKMRSILFEIGLPYVKPSELFIVEEGEVRNILQCTFRKTSNAPLQETDFGLAVKTTGAASGFYQPEFGHDGLFVWYRDRATSINRAINPNVFLYRSGLSIKTNPADELITTSAKLHGIFWQGATNLPVSHTILDTTGSVLTGSAKLNHDAIAQYGFIYTLSDVNISINEFTDSIKINGINYTVPTPAEYAALEFVRGGYTFYITPVGNNNGTSYTLPYETTLGGLIPNQKYYAWAYAHYTFETSKSFQAVGNRIDFETTGCVALNIGTVFTVKEPLCGANDGAIQVHVIGGSGNYQFSVNGGTFNAYPNDIITGLTAGTYTIAVKDATQPVCDSTVIENVVLHSAGTDLNMMLTAYNAPSCSGKGSLYVNVTGGAPDYSYTLNGAQAPVVDGWINNLPVGEYELVVKDQNQCVASSGKVHIYADDSQLAADVTIISQAACDQNTGAFKFTVSGLSNDSFIYQLDGYNAQTVQGYTGGEIVLSDLSAGVHNLTVTDECNQIAETITITNGCGDDAFTFTAIPTNETLDCNNQLVAGSITLHITPGPDCDDDDDDDIDLSSPFRTSGTGYKYRINNGAWLPLAESAVILNLHQGFYHIEVMDTTTKCTYQVNNIVIGREVYTPLNVGTMFAAKDPACGASDGEIQVHATGGSGLYLYSVNGATPKYYDNGLITGLEAGYYTITVTDSLFTTCSGVTEDIVLHNANTNLNVTLTAHNAVTCSGNGSLFVTVTGGSGEYDYFFGNTQVYVIDGWINNLPVGEYHLLVKDKNNNCVASSEKVRISATQSVLAVNITNTEDATCGSSTGSVTFSVSASNTTPYHYQLDGLAEHTGTGSAPIVLTGLGAGAHTLRVWDNCGEEVKEFNITNGAGTFASTATPRNETLDCVNNLVAGSIALTITGGAQNANYEYSINGSAWEPLASSHIIPDLHQGFYRVELRDVTTKCTYQVNNVTIDREIFTPINVGTIYSAYEPSCRDNDGQIQVYATGGSGSYLYTVNGVGPTSYPDGLITGLSAGYYTITVTDAIYTNCPGATVDNITLHNANTDLNVTLTATNAQTCNGTGSLFVTVTGGSGDYSYSLNGTTPTIVNGWINNLPTGEYELVVTDEKGGCVASSEKVRISATQSVLAVSITNKVDATCGSSTGSITFNVTNSNSAQYHYQLDAHSEQTGSGSAPIVLTGLNAGIHTLRVWDNCGEKVEVFTITNGSNSFAFTATPHNEILGCDDELTPGFISLQITGGTASYTYSVNGGEWLPLNASTITNLHHGIYRIAVKDANDCTFEVNQVTVGREIYTPLNAGTVFAAKDPACGANDGQIQIYVTGGSGLYLYSVNGSAPKYYANGLITDLAAGTYTITVTDSLFKTCLGTTIDNIVLHNADTDLAINVNTENATDCSASDGKLIFTAAGGSGNYEFYMNGSLVTSPVYKPAGEYVVTVKDQNSNCVASSGVVRINSNTSTLAINVHVDENATCGSSTGVVTVTVSNATSYTYQLDGNPAVQGSGNSFVLNGLSAGKHYLKVTDNCGEAIKEFEITNGVKGLTFTVTSENEILTCEGELLPGNITLTVANGTPDFEYSINGSSWKPFTTSVRTEVIDNLSNGIYRIEVRDANGCTYQINHVTVDRESSAGTLMTSPVATTPQTFCSNATVANLQATGVGIKWYLTETGGNALLPTQKLDSGRIYYAAQSIGNCESQVRTAVKVYINPEAVIDTPQIHTPQLFCSATATLADMATDGNTNIVWYETANSTNVLPLTTPLVNGKTYYAAIKAGDCESSKRVAVTVQLNVPNINAPVIETPQYFCEGALIGNIAVPDNKIVWYATATSTEPLPADYVLENNATYYAAQQAGDCESTTRTAVTVIFNTPLAPDAPEVQGVCEKVTLADLTVTGAGIVWYDAENDGNQLPLSTVLVVGKTYWAAQSSQDCEGERTGVTITDACWKVYGTVFPFVHYGNEEKDTLYNVTVSLYNVPAAGNDPIDAILASAPVKQVTATYYDGSVFIPGTPKNPGAMGSASNPGMTISWDKIGKTPGTIDNTTVTREDNTTSKPVGMYTFENVVAGEYVLEIRREGFLTRWAKVQIAENKSLGHREILAGEFNDDFAVRINDISILNAQIGQPNADSKFDIDGSLHIDGGDIDIIMFNIGAFINIYEETEQWVSGY